MHSAPQCSRKTKQSEYFFPFITIKILMWMFGINYTYVHLHDCEHSEMTT